jgi:hypothetical protein
MRQTPAATLSRAFLQYAAAGAVYGLTFPGVVRLGRKLSLAHNNPRLCELIFSHPFSDQGLWNSHVRLRAVRANGAYRPLFSTYGSIRRHNPPFTCIGGRTFGGRLRPVNRPSDC